MYVASIVFNAFELFDFREKKVIERAQETLTEVNQDDRLIYLVTFEEGQNPRQVARLSHAVNKDLGEIFHGMYLLKERTRAEYIRIAENIIGGPKSTLFVGGLDDVRFAQQIGAYACFLEQGSRTRPNPKQAPADGYHIIKTIDDLPGLIQKVDEL